MNKSFFKKKCVRLYVCMSVCVFESLTKYVFMSQGAYGGQKRTLDLLELELKAVENCKT